MPVSQSDFKTKALHSRARSICGREGGGGGVGGTKKTNWEHLLFSFKEQSLLSPVFCKHQGKTRKNVPLSLYAGTLCPKKTNSVAQPKGHTTG